MNLLGKIEIKGPKLKEGKMFLARSMAEMIKKLQKYLQELQNKENVEDR